MFAAIGTLVIVALLSMTVTRVAAGALVATGLPPDIARFQARSAFTGVGFTTNESANVVRHPQRRRVVFHLMLLGNLGTATVLATLVLGILAPGPLQADARFFLILGGVAVLFVVLRFGPIDRAFTRFGMRAGPRWAGQHVDGPVELLDVGSDRVVVEVAITGGADAGPERRRLDIPPGQVLVIGVVGADGEFRDVWAPNGVTDYAVGETVVLFGRSAVLRRLAPDPAGTGAGG
jgi:hypothetical protein